ncbi:MAG: DNA-methyltransferase, partial [Blastocatellia bacterium]
VQTSIVSSVQTDKTRYSPGKVSEAIIHIMSQTPSPMSVSDLELRVNQIVGPTPSSSIRSYLRLNTPDIFLREERGVYRLKQSSFTPPSNGPEPNNEQNIFNFGRARLIQADCFEWLASRELNSIHAVVTDPPYGLHEYTDEQQTKLRNGKGGVWRIPPSYDGHTRAPLPRFTTLTREQLEELKTFFALWARLLLPKLVPGGHVLLATNPLLSYIVSQALAESGLERRGEIVRLTMTMRGGDRPKAAHQEFSDVSMMARSAWEPWLVFRRPLEGRAQDNLRKWKTGGFRRPSTDKPFADVIESSPTGKNERAIAPHPSLKPQAFMRQIVRAVLPLGEGVVVDPFAGAGSTLAAAEAIGYQSIGIEKDDHFFKVACDAIPALALLKTKTPKP